MHIWFRFVPRINKVVSVFCLRVCSAASPTVSLFLESKEIACAVPSVDGRWLCWRPLSEMTCNSLPALLGSERNGAIDIVPPVPTLLHLHSICPLPVVPLAFRTPRFICMCMPSKGSFVVIFSFRSCLARIGKPAQRGPSFSPRAGLAVGTALLAG